MNFLPGRIQKQAGDVPACYNSFDLFPGEDV